MSGKICLNDKHNATQVCYNFSRNIYSNHILFTVLFPDLNKTEQGFSLLV